MPKKDTEVAETKTIKDLYATDKKKNKKKKKRLYTINRKKP